MQSLTGDAKDPPISVTFYPDYDCGSERGNKTYVEVFEHLPENSNLPTATRTEL